MKHWQKKINYCIAILASFFMIEQGMKVNIEDSLVFGYQEEESSSFDYREENVKIQSKEGYREVEWGKVYQLKENGIEVLFENSAGNIEIFEYREGNKRKILEEEIYSSFWLYDIDKDGCLEIMTGEEGTEGSFYDWNEEKHQFIKAYQKYLSHPEKNQDFIFINKNTEEKVSDIERATYYELSIYDKKNEGELLQNIKYPFVEDEWSAANNFSFLDVNFDEYTDLALTFQREYTYGSPLDFLFYWNPEKREFENAFGGDILEYPYENAACLYEIDTEKEWMLMYDPLGTGCREERLYKFIDEKWELCRQLYIQDLVIYPVYICLEDSIQGKVIFEEDIPREEFYEREEEFYEMFYKGMNEKEGQH